jgi:HSP20 family protein
MAMSPYRPSTDLVGSMFEDMLRPLSGWGGRMAAMGMLRAPEADVVETEGEIRVLVELPGMRAEDVELDLENNILTISGEKREERREGNDTWHLSERRYGKFSRSFVLPRDVEQERIAARFEDGVLSVTIPKSEQARRRRIEIQHGGGQKRVEANTGGGK